MVITLKLHLQRIKGLSTILLIFQVKVTQTIAGQDDPQEVRRLKRGEYFGEKSLIRYEDLYYSIALLEPLRLCPIELATLV